MTSKARELNAPKTTRNARAWRARARAGWGRRARASERGERDDDDEGRTTSTSSSKEGDREREDVRTTARRRAMEGISVVVVPGFLANANDYAALAKELEKRGARVEVAPWSANDWLPTLVGGDFVRLLDKLDACARALREEEEEGGKLVVVAHSAGGWLSRLWLGADVAYCGREPYRGRDIARVLVTLGTPHASKEAYPFGRARERRGGESGRAMSLSDAARGSSLALTNEIYPGAHERDVKYVAVTGALDFVGSDAFDFAGVVRKACRRFIDGDGGDAWRDGTKDIADAWRAYLAGVSYKANTGGDARVVGDGICPASVAELDGAEIVRVACHHSPNARCDWYGSPAIVDAWVPYIL